MPQIQCRSVLSILGLESENLDESELLSDLSKMLLDDKNVTSVTKITIAMFIESEPSLLSSVTDVELVYATFMNVYQSSNLKDDITLKGQCLSTMTSVLLQSFTEFKGNELLIVFSNLFNLLLKLVKQQIDGNVYIKSVAINCLMELELCFPTLLRDLLDDFYSAAVAEITTAHQHYLCLVSLIISQSISQDIKFPAIAECKADLIPEVKKHVCTEKSSQEFSFPNVNQVVSFLVDQLPLCSVEAVAWLIQKASIIMEKHPSTVQLIKPLLLTYAHSQHILIFHTVFQLEAKFGELLFDNWGYNQFINQLELNTCNSALQLSMRLTFMDLFGDYLSRFPQNKWTLNRAPMLLPHCFDGPEVKTKKMQFLCEVLSITEESVMVLMSALNGLKKDVMYNPTVKNKSSLMKALFKCLSGTKNLNISDDVIRILADVTENDITTVPFVLNFLYCSAKTPDGSYILQQTLDTLLNIFTVGEFVVSLENLPHALSLFRMVILQKQHLDAAKVILKFLSQRVLSMEVCEMLPWNIGHQILSLCYVIMIEENDTANLFSDLTDVLKKFVDYVDNIDLKDRAQLYVRIINCQAIKKIKAPKQIATNRLLNEDYKFGMTINYLKKPIFRLEKVYYSARKSEDEDFEEEECLFSEDDIREYYKEVRKYGEDHGFTIRCSLMKTDDFPIDVIMVEALDIQFFVSGEWGHIKPLSVGHFSNTSESREQNNCDQKIVCHPKKSVPTVVKSRCEFSINNIFHICPLNPIILNIEDYFLPLPSKEFNKKVGRKTLFNNLWNYFKNASNTNCGSSVTILHQPAEIVTECIRQKLGWLLIEESSDSKIFHAGIYLPPSSHLLMKFTVRESSTVAHLTGDDIDALSYLSLYFKSWWN